MTCSVGEETGDREHTQLEKNLNEDWLNTREGTIGTVDIIMHKESAIGNNKLAEDQDED